MLEKLNNIRLSKNDIIKIGITLSVMTVIYILLLMPMAHANYAVDFANEIYETVYVGGTTDSILTIFQSNYTDEALSFGEPYIDWLSGVGCVIAVIIMVVKIQDNMSKGRDDYEAIYEGVTAFLITAFVCIWSKEIITLVVKLGTLFSDNMALVVRNETTNELTRDIAAEQAAADFEKIDGTIEALGFIIKNIIFWLFSLFLTAMIKMVAFSIIIEMGIRRIFFPFAIVDIYGEGLRSPGMRYIKKFLAVFIRIAICTAVAYLGTQLTTLTQGNYSDADAILTNGLNNTINRLACGYTTIGVMMKGQDLANDIVGA